MDVVCDPDYLMFTGTAKLCRLGGGDLHAPEVPNLLLPKSSAAATQINVADARCSQ